MKVLLLVLAFAGVADAACQNQFYDAGRCGIYWWRQCVTDGCPAGTGVQGCGWFSYNKPNGNHIHANYPPNFCSEWTNFDRWWCVCVTGESYNACANLIGKIC